ncbi:MAG: Uma2 family endonuclease [Pseudomonadota bacterium]|nr:Uma2 family endonuclease [Pseudomonadota bacterium]MDP1904603.1 Uma2 family endonuclease [Pseudomonadota bacterium]MDP2353198.1 Uma2 family endonuclease [Pseudomonadota bacterium]
MGLPQPAPHFNLDGYMAWEARQAERHEYVAGEVFGREGASSTHNIINGNLAIGLRSALRGTPCRVFLIDMKLRVDAADAVFYPDVLVTCDPRDKTPEADTAKRHPSLIVEVLSDSTAAYDRGFKFEQYRAIDTLREYLLVEQNRRHIDLFRRGEEGRWVLEPISDTNKIALLDTRVTLSLDELYEDVEFAEQAE